MTLTLPREFDRLEEVAEGVYVRDMLTVYQAIDLFCSQGLSRQTRADYLRILDKFAEPFPVTMDVAKITDEDCMRFLAHRVRMQMRGGDPRTPLSPGYLRWQEMVLSSFFRWLYRSRKIKVNPMEFVPRTRRPDPDSLDVKTISSDEVRRLLAAASSWPEKLCIGVLVYLGPRRGAVARLRLSDYDGERGRLRFHEKGGKTIWKPVPDELAALIGAAVEAGVYTSATGVSTASPDGEKGATSRAARASRTVAAAGVAESGSITSPLLHGGGGPREDHAPVVGAVTSGASMGLARGEMRPAKSGPSDPYLIPPEGPLARKGDRDDRVIWRLVRKVAKRAGVNTDVHTLRRAFADFWFDNGGDEKALQLLLGHKSPGTTQGYARRWDTQRRMEPVRGLSWEKVE